MSTPKRTPIYTQRHNISGPRLTFALPHEGKELLSGLGDKSRKAITLSKQDDLSVVLMAIRGGEKLADHAAAGTVTIQVVEGRVRINLEDEEIPAQQGTLVQLGGGVRHDVQADTDAVVLITIAANDVPEASSD
jgi:quercetin dioxygenase-like cupin family protein